jgi:hypothetical protein
MVRAKLLLIIVILIAIYNYLSEFESAPKNNSESESCTLRF